MSICDAVIVCSFEVFQHVMCQLHVCSGRVMDVPGDYCSSKGDIESSDIREVAKITYARSVFSFSSSFSAVPFASLSNDGFLGSGMALSFAYCMQCFCSIFYEVRLFDVDWAVVLALYFPSEVG